jgi:hypothetical protein
MGCESVEGFQLAQDRVQWRALLKTEFSNRRRIFLRNGASITDWTTPYSKDLPEKLIVTQQVKKFPLAYVTRRFIIVFTTAHHWTVS